jgi:hypothetical protein
MNLFMGKSEKDGIANSGGCKGHGGSQASGYNHVPGVVTRCAQFLLKPQPVSADLLQSMSNIAAMVHSRSRRREPDVLDGSWVLLCLGFAQMTSMGRSLTMTFGFVLKAC